MDRYNKFFDEADTDKSGYLTMDELTAVLTKKGHRAQDVKGFFRSVDTSGDNKISRQEFLQAMGCVPPDQHTGAAMRQVFREFDKDGNGKVDKKELKQVFAEMGKHFSDAELKRMIEMMDADGSGEVDYEEFIGYFTCKSK